MAQRLTSRIGLDYILRRETARFGLRFTLRQRRQHDQPITGSHVQAVALEGTELGYYKCVVERRRSLIRPRLTPGMRQFQRGFATDQNRWQGEC